MAERKTAATSNRDDGSKFKSIRPLLASEIECRVGTMKKDGSGCSLLLYKDARVDMRLLDEVFGPMNWKRTHDVVNGNLFCTLSIWDSEKKEWVSKQDVGVESKTEAEKGQASDAFKRAGFNWGIGRELYTGPFIWIKLDKSEVYQNGASFGLSTKFQVKDIGYDTNKEIDKLVITDNKGNVRFTFGNTKEKVAKLATEQGSGTVFTGSELDIAIKEMTGVKSRQELEQVWRKYPAMHNNSDFRNITMEMGKTYPQKK